MAASLAPSSTRPNAHGGTVRMRTRAFRLARGSGSTRIRLFAHETARVPVGAAGVPDDAGLWDDRQGHPVLLALSQVGYDTVNPYSVRLPLGRYVDGGGSYRFPFDTASGYRECPSRCSGVFT